MQSPGNTGKVCLRGYGVFVSSQGICKPLDPWKWLKLPLFRDEIPFKLVIQIRRGGDHIWGSMGFLHFYHGTELHYVNLRGNESSGAGGLGVSSVGHKVWARLEAVY